MASARKATAACNRSSGSAQLKRRMPSQLHDWRNTREGRVRHLAEDVDHVRIADRIAQAPAAHTVRLAEGIRGNDLIQHSGLRQDCMMPAFPYHVAVRLVAEKRN